MSWLKKLISADNSDTDLKAVLSVMAFLMAVLMYAAYGIKGLFISWEMPAAVRDITVALIVGGAATAGSTILNQRLGVGPPAPPVPPEQPPPGPVG